MDDHLDITERLRSFGLHPVDPAVESQHLTAMAGAVPSARRNLAFRIQIAAALVIGLLALSTGLAVAQVDAGPISDVGEKVASVVGVDVTDGTVTHGTRRYYGDDCLRIEGGKGARNRGQYLKWVRQNHPEMLDAAKASKCGKPVKSANKPDDDHD